MPREQNHASINFGIWCCVAVGLLAYVAFPWYAIQDSNGLLSMPQVFSNEQAGNGLIQATSYQRP